MVRSKYLLALAIAAGCAVPRPVVEYEAARHQADLAATDPSAVRVIPADQLPDGIALDGVRLTADPGIPSPDDPHVVLGEVHVRLDTRQPREMWLHAMQVEAAQHGANALVVVDENGESCSSRHDDYKCRLAIAVHLSSAAPATFAAATDVLHGWIAAHADKGKPIGKTEAIDLAEPRRITYTPKHGECVTFVIALDDDAHVAHHGSDPTLALDAVSAADHVHRENFATGDWGLRDRALSVDAACAEDASPLTLSISARTDGTGAPGRGRAIVQVVHRTVDDKTLARMEQDEADETEQADEDLSRVKQAECDRCIDEWKACVRWDPAVERGECPGYNHCLERAYTSWEQCP
jgi:hypothetical protein